MRLGLGGSERGIRRETAAEAGIEELVGVIDRVEREGTRGTGFGG